MKRTKTILSAVLVLIIVFSMICVFPASASSTSPVLWLKFDGDFKDSSGNMNDATKAGSVTFADDGAVGKCAVFSGGFLKVMPFSTLNLGKTFTISAWVKLNPEEAALNRYNYIVTKENSAPDYYDGPLLYTLYTGGTHDLNLEIAAMANGYTNGAATSGVGSYEFQEKWSMVTAVDDGTMFWLYVDGKQVASGQSGDKNGYFDDLSGGILYIGGFSNDDVNLHGKIDDLRMYKTAFSDEDVMALYNEVMNAYPHKITLTIDDSQMSVDGRFFQIDPLSEYTRPRLVDGRTMVPIRAIIENMGGTVGWDGKERRVDIKLRDITVNLWLDNKNAKVNGNSITLDVPAQTINDRTMVPVRFVTENLGAKVSWDKDTQTVTIQYK